MKKKALKFLTVALALAALSLPALAQSDTQTQGTEPTYGRHGRMSVDERMQHLTQALNLSADQQAKVKSILQDQHKEMQSLRQDTSLSQQDRRAKFQQVRQDTHQKIRDVLNDEQKAKFDEMKSRHQGRMGKHGPPSGSSEKQ